jgi:hypothetical protein
MSRILVLGLLFCSLLPAQTLTTDKLKGFIESSIKMKYPDKQVAEYLKHIKLTDKLDDSAIEDLQGMGAGPKTVAALKILGDASKNLAPPPPPPVKPVVSAIPPPDSIEQKKIRQDMEDYAREYSSHLPNYICTQVVRRSVDPGSTGFWHQMDTVTIKLTYFEQHEKYEVVMMNNRIVNNVNYESLQGATSEGEFGSMMKEIFEPGTHTEFEWDRWGTLRGKRMHVFSYRVAQPNSKWSILYEKTDRMTPGYHGLIYVDKDMLSIMRITLEADDIPPLFPVQMARTTLDYDFIDISGHQFVLPLKSSMEMRAGREMVKNENEYRLYRKYGAETTITYETPAALPDSQTKEEPVPGPPQPK